MRATLAIAGRELRTVLRSPSSTVAFTGFLAGTALIAAVARRRAAGLGIGDGDVPLTPVEVANAGRSVFEWVVLAVAIGLVVALPGLLAGAFAGERERGTLAMVLGSPARGRGLVLGKAMAAVALVLLFTIAAVPVLVAAYLLGGVTASDVGRAVGALVLTGVVVAFLTLACSASMQRAAPAAGVAYGLVLVLTLGTALVRVAAGDPVGPIDEAASVRALALNPVVLTAAAVGEPDQLAAGEAATMGPFRGVREAVAGTVPPPPTSTTTTTDPELTLRFGPMMPAATTTTEPEVAVAVPLDRGRIDEQRKTSTMVLAGLALLCLPAAAVRLRSPGRRRP